MSTDVVPTDGPPPGNDLAVREPGTLFRTDEPALIVARATEVAEVLSKVLKERGLTKRIGPKDHVLVEGWTLCGSMLGVFPVVVWTRRLPDGWEARVEAKTRDGAVVGSAEAMCSHDESRWADADEYAVRSMAQTRATSKAMRGPLGFIVQLAGFEPAPAEEMDGVRTNLKSQPDPESPEFDPGVHLLEGTIQGDKFFERMAVALKAIDPVVDWKLTLEPIDLPRDATFNRRMSNFVAKLGDLESFPPPDDDTIVAALAWAFEGRVLELVRPEQVELDEEATAAVERDGDGPVIDQEDDDEPDEDLISGEVVDEALASGDDDDIEF